MTRLLVRGRGSLVQIDVGASRLVHLPGASFVSLYDCRRTVCSHY